MASRKRRGSPRKASRSRRRVGRPKKTSRSRRTVKRSVKRNVKRSPKKTVKRSVKRSPKRTVKRSVRRSPNRKSRVRKSRSKGRKDFKPIGPLRKGELKQFGYSTTKNATARHRALAQAVRAYNPLSVFRKLNAVMVLTKNRSPGASAKFKADRDWVKRTYKV